MNVLRGVARELSHHYLKLSRSTVRILQINKYDKKKFNMGGVKEIIIRRVVSQIKKRDIRERCGKKG